jgi:hypothetical protein
MKKRKSLESQIEHNCVLDLSIIQSKKLEILKYDNNNNKNNNNNLLFHF